MSFTVLDVPQRSEAWHRCRLGRLTGSVAAEMCATVKTGEAAGRRNLRVRLTLERITGRSHASEFVSTAMQQGIDREVDACALYEALTGQMLSQSGFLSHVTLMAGCSLDGHVGDFEGIVEVKSPQAATHLEYLKTGLIPGNYQKQILHNLWISGARWCDWLSYQPDFPEGLQVKLVRVMRDEAAITDYEHKAVAFLEEVQREVEVVQTLANLRGTLELAAPGADGPMAFRRTP